MRTSFTQSYEAAEGVNAIRKIDVFWDVLPAAGMSVYVTGPDLNVIRGVVEHVQLLGGSDGCCVEVLVKPLGG